MIETYFVPCGNSSKYGPWTSTHQSVSWSLASNLYCWNEEQIHRAVAPVTYLWSRELEKVGRKLLYYVSS